MHTPHDPVADTVPRCAAPNRETTKPKGTAPPPGAAPVGAAPVASAASSITTLSATLPSVPGYEILQELGRGSMGVVYKARQLGIDRVVALKMILAGSHAGQEALQRFTVEARSVAALQHPNIIRLYDIDLQQPCPFFSMEYVDGGTLADRLDGAPQSCRQAAQLTVTLARAIHVAHQNGIVHRDLKPANILLASLESRDSQVQRMARELGLYAPDFGLGMPKITDFGLAKQLHADAGRTESGIILGTASYMAPEQAEGKSHEVGPTADIYALGAILYEMLTGRPPFTAESPMETVLLLFQTEPVRPSQLLPRIPRDLETICLKCLQKDPRRRYASAEELADDLQRFLAGEPILAKPARLPEKLWKWMRRRPALASLAGCALLAVASIVGLSIWHQTDLQARLGQALDDEREARQAEEVASSRERLGQLRVKLKEMVHAGETAIVAQDWDTAHLQLTRARDQAAAESELADLHAHIELLLRQTTQQRVDRERLATFVQRRNETLFQATMFTGGDLAATLSETRAAAIATLALFGVTPDSSSAPLLDSPCYTAAQKAEIVLACYELLVVLADAVVEPLPEHRESDRRRQAEEAIAILDRAARLGVTTQSYHRRRAQYLAMAGQEAAADEERRRANLLRPSTAIDHFLLGQEEYRRGACPKAIASFENVLQVQPDHFWASYYSALCWLKTQRPSQAAACLTSCLGQRRDFPWPYLLRALAWGELGQFSRAEEDFEVALKGSLPETARYSLLINRGVLRIRQGNIDSAVADLKQAVALRPERYQAYVNLAQVHLKSRQLDNAIEQLDEAIRRESNLAALYRTRARVHLLRQDHGAALKDLDKAIELAKDAAPQLADDHLERARILHREKRSEEALEACAAALRIRPRDAGVGRLRSEVLLELKRYPQALQALDDCVQHGPPDAGVFRARAALRTRLGQYAGAQTDYTRALEIEPSAATYAARGWCFLVADAPRLALSDFEEAIRRAPEQGDSYAGRGYARVLLSEQRLAVDDAEEALRRGPTSARLLYNAARIYAQAVAKLDSENPLLTGDAGRWRGRWHHRAMALLIQALEAQPATERAHFWQNVVQTDRAMNGLRRGADFNELAARFPIRQASAAPASIQQKH